MMDQDDKLINDALHMAGVEAKKKPSKHKESCSFDEDYDIVIPKTDAINRMVAKKKRQVSFKAKSIKDWSNADFIKFINSTLKETFGMTLESMGARAIDSIAKSYDKLLKCAGNSMIVNNEVMRDYVVWWISAYASNSKKPVLYVEAMNNELHMKRFIKEYSGKTPVMSYSLEKPKSKPILLTDEELVASGGLPMLLLAKGIVNTVKYLKLKKEKMAFSKVSSALRCLSKEAAGQVLDKTLDMAPYNIQDKVDFVSLAKSVVDLYGLSQFKGFDYKSAFSDSI